MEKALTLVEKFNPFVSFPFLKYCIHSRAGYQTRVAQFWKCEAVWKRADDFILAKKGVNDERADEV